MENTLTIFGKNAVMEALLAKAAKLVYIREGARKSDKLREITELAKSQKVLIKEITAAKLDLLAAAAESEISARHGGVAAEVLIKYATLEELLTETFILILDSIEDPHNLGALIRTAESAGVGGVIIPKRRSAGITAAVYSSSAGAVAHMKISRVTNLTDAIKLLKSSNIWVYGAEADGDSCYDADFSGGGGIALVIGSEGRGLTRLVRENCDFIISIPMRGRLNSLNASVSGGILMFEIAKAIFQKGGQVK